MSTESSPQEPMPADGGYERRQAERIKRDSSAQLIFWPSSARTPPLEVELFDYSRTGVGVVFEQGIIIGQKFVLREPFVTRDSTCLYTVARCNRRDDGRFSIGLHICEAASDVPSADAQEPGSSPAYNWALAAMVAAVITATVILFR